MWRGRERERVCVCATMYSSTILCRVGEGEIVHRGEDCVV